MGPCVLESTGVLAWHSSEALDAACSMGCCRLHAQAGTVCLRPTKGYWNQHCSLTPTSLWRRSWEHHRPQDVHDNYLQMLCLSLSLSFTLCYCRGLSTLNQIWKHSTKTCSTAQIYTREEAKVPFPAQCTSSSCHCQPCQPKEGQLAACLPVCTPWDLRCSWGLTCIPFLAHGFQMVGATLQIWPSRCLHAASS